MNGRVRRAVVAIALFGFTAGGAACGESSVGTSSRPSDDGAPYASALASVTSGLAPLTVDFTGVAADPTTGGDDGAFSFGWTFGDGEASDLQSPTHVYELPGTYVASFTVADDDGDSSTSTVSISVGSAEQPAVTAAADRTTGIAPLDVQFSATVAGGDAPVQLTWSFGDGESSAQAAAAHTFGIPGDYGVTVTAVDANGDLAEARITIQVAAPQVATTPDLLLVNAGYTLDRSADAYEPNDATPFALGNPLDDEQPIVLTGKIDRTAVQYHVDVINAGAAAGAFDVDLYPGAVTPPSAATAGAQKSAVLSLASNGTRRVYFFLDDVTPGIAHRAYLRVDRTNTVGEIDEQNNLSAPVELVAPADEDWFSVDLIAGQTLRLDLDQLPFDYDLELYTDAKQLLASSLRGGTSPESIERTVSITARYRVRVFGYAGARSATQPYRLRVTSH